MDEPSLAEKEYDLLSEKLQRHGGFAYQVIPITVAVAGGLLAIGKSSTIGVAPFVAGGLLFLLIAWAISNTQVLYLGKRLIQIERAWNDKLKRKGSDIRVLAWHKTLCEFPRWFIPYSLLIGVLMTLLFMVALFYTAKGLPELLCQLGVEADDAKETVALIVLSALVMVALVVACSVLYLHYHFRKHWCRFVRILRRSKVKPGLV